MRRPRIAHLIVRSRNIACIASVALIGVAVVPSGQARAALSTLGLVAQTFNVSATGTVDLTVSIPIDAAVPLTNLTVTVTAFRPVATRQAVADVVAGSLPRSIDSVTVSPALVARPAPDQLKVSIPLEITTHTPDALQLADAGLYPILVELTEATVVVAELVTFVHRLPADGEDPELPMAIAMAVSAGDAVQLDNRANVIVGADVIRELTSLADLLEVSALPVTVRVPPSLLTEVRVTGSDGAALADRLNQAMSHNNLLSSPILPLDPSAAAADGQQALYTRWLRDGEDSLAKTVTTTSQRTVVLIDRPLSEAGAGLLRDLGARLLVMPPSIYDELPNSPSVFTDTTQLVQLQVAPGVTIDTTVVDRFATRTLSRITTTPQLSAIYAVTDLLAARRQVQDQGGDPRRHGLTLAAADLTLPSPTGFTEFTSLLATTPGLRPTTLDDLSVRTDELLGGEGPIVVNLPSKVAADINTRMKVTDKISLEALSMASMLPADDTRRDEWSRLIAALPTSALSDTQATSITAGLRDEFDGLRNAVGVPLGFSFNLTGRKGTVPLTLHNSSPIPLTVRVRMSSSKLLFPGGDRIVTLAPDSFTQVQVAIDARSNGDLPVTLDVFTPLGDLRLAPAVPLTASINALSGIGTLVTGAALLVLLTWWSRHIRKNRRGRQVVAAASETSTLTPS